MDCASTPSAPRLRGNDESGKVLDDNFLIACRTGAIRPNIIQRAGKPAMPLADFLRGKTISAGTRLA
jgi:methionyl-tRNA formyltransferase